ncbi:Aste57867_7506 [Aphanomyces stellatus]|uniref:Aste57867_7506 protein n=1 Tax=Aphanomyces stellatus TaxID=120398 RepID=A0A485KIE0_9STRA|nr:hypothetical protein As57867_007480 [Aphanomyces stellatus]VFT84415.1 Aste57867_7506 [Aphanomyces stellatus]
MLVVAFKVVILGLDTQATIPSFYMPIQLSVAPSSRTLSNNLHPKQHLPSSLSTSVLHRIQTLRIALLWLAGNFFAILICLDVITNNWELIDYVGDGLQLLTPFLDLGTFDDVQAQYVFATAASPATMSKVGRFMTDTVASQIATMDGSSYYLSLGSYLIQDSSNDICGTLVQTYVLPPANTTTSRSSTTTAPTIRLGTSTDAITFIRGNTLTHWFGTTLTDPRATAGANASTLTSMGYVPAKVSTDLRLTTPVPLVKPNTMLTMNVSMFRFAGSSFCSGCIPTTELGFDTCSIVYSYNDTANQVVVKSSMAIIGNVHEVGMIFQRNAAPILSIVVRAFCVVFALAAYAASQKTVRWCEPSDSVSWLTRLVRIVSPVKYRHPSHAFDFAYLCLNSDIFVVLYTISVIADENIGMVYSRTVYRWYQYSSFDLLIELRLMALCFRWLWINLLLVKGFKWLCHVVSSAMYTGDNWIMGWLNYSSVDWIYAGLFVLFERNSFIEYGNSVRASVKSSVQDLDNIFVNLLQSWYVRAVWPMAIALIVNLIATLALDHVLHRRWWCQVRFNSLGRQFMYNSTSVLINADLAAVVATRPGYVATVVTTKARMLCTMQWFFSTHVLCFGLPEHPNVVRQLVATKATQKTTNGATGGGKTTKTNHTPSHQSTEAVTSSITSRRGSSVDPSPPPEVTHAHSFIAEDAPRRSSSEASSAEENGSKPNLYVLSQDRDGYIHLFDADKREMQALSLEVKVLRDSTLSIG